MDCYYFEKIFVKLPKEMNSYNTLLAETKKQMKQMLHEGITLEQMREANINKARRMKVKIQLLQLAMTGKTLIGKDKRALYGDYIEFAHAVIICAYIKACEWGDDFGIMLHDGSMPLLPKQESKELFRKVAKVVETQMNKN
jgi:hypothetical protein